MKTWHYLVRLVLFNPWIYIAEGAVRIFWILTFLVEGLLISAFFDAVSDHNSFSVPEVAGLFLTTRMIRVGLLVGGIILMVLVKYTSGTLLRKNLLLHALEDVASSHSTYSPGELVNCFRDDITGIAAFLSNALWVVTYSLAAIVAIILMIRINLLLTVIGLLPLIAGGAIVYVARKRVERYRGAARNATGRAVGTLGEMFSIAEAIKVSRADTRVTEHLRQLNQERGEYAIFESVLSAILDAASGNTTAVGTALLLLLAAYDMRAGTFTVGNFAMFIYYIGWLADLPNRIGRIFVGYKRVGVSLEKMANFSQQGKPAQLVKYSPIHLKGPLPPLPAYAQSAEDRLITLEVRHLTYRYPGTEKGIINIHFRLKHGSFVAITGRVGAGKTTLLRTLLGLLRMDAGEIRWNDHLVEEPSNVFVPPLCAYVPQVSHLFNTSIKDNILLGLAEDMATLNAAIVQAVLDEDIASLEMGLDTQVGARGMKLSGGQQQRVAAARMFVRKAELLVFDDLSSALDVNTERLFWKRLVQKDDVICLAVTHSRIALQHADHVLLLKDGMLHDSGTLQELLGRSQEMRLLWDQTV